MIIYNLKLILPRKKFTTENSFWRLLETVHDIHGFSCIETVEKAIKIHQKCIFQPLHNEVKSVLGIKESYSMEKRPKTAFSQFFFLPLS